jgi:hypothetical protein
VAHNESDRWLETYWEYNARFGRRKRVWRSGWDHWGLKFYRGGDEFSRNTIVIGPLVFALWSCRCGECKAEKKRLEEYLDSEG